jgi:hypothetical protein
MGDGHTTGPWHSHRQVQQNFRVPQKQSCQSRQTGSTYTVAPKLHRSVQHNWLSGVQHVCLLASWWPLCLCML